MSKPKEFDEIIHCERIGDSLLYNHYVVGELVRCRDCKYYCKSLIDEVTNLPMCGAWSAPQKQDGFCNYGERKDEVEE